MKTFARWQLAGRLQGLLVFVVLLSGAAVPAPDTEPDQKAPEPVLLEVADNVFLAVVPKHHSPVEALDSVQVVIDLRYPYEGVYDELGALRERGITHVNIPTSSREPEQDQVLALEEALAAHAGSIILIHDSTGHRAAMLWAAHLLHAGTPLDEALDSVAALFPPAELRPKLTTYRDQLAAAANAETVAPPQDDPTP